MTTDVNAFLGSYPFRRVPGTSPEALLKAMDRVGIADAWVSHLPSLWWRNPSEGNPWLYETSLRFSRLLAVPAIHPGVPRWETALADALARGVPLVRADPGPFGLDPTSKPMTRLVAAAAEAEIPVLLAVRLEDGRQRHPKDTAPELTAAAVRALIRVDPRARLLVTHAERSFMEEVHFGSTPDEAGRLWWDISWIWGPPEDHLQILLKTIGSDRFVFGTGQPLRLPENAVAKLDLLDLAPQSREAIESTNARSLLAKRGSS
jgi:predicted TIM-barrel fold metal-dependent hydrolase